MAAVLAVAAAVAVVTLGGSDEGATPKGATAAAAKPAGDAQQGVAEDGQTLADYAAEISKQLGREIEVEPALRQRPLSPPHPGNLPVEDAFLVALREFDDVEVVDNEGSALRVVYMPRIELRELGVKTQTALEHVAKRAGLELKVATPLNGTLSMELADARWPDALAAIARAANLDFEVQGQSLAVRVRSEPRPEAQPPRDTHLWWPPKDDGSQRIAVTAKDELLSELLDRLGVELKKDLLVAPEADRRVTLEIPETSWQEALVTIASMSKLVCQDLGGVILMAEPSFYSAEEVPAAPLILALARCSGVSVVVADDCEGVLSGSASGAGGAAGGGWFLGGLAKVNGGTVHAVTPELFVFSGKPSPASMDVSSGTISAWGRLGPGEEGSFVFVDGKFAFSGESFTLGGEELTLLKVKRGALEVRGSGGVKELSLGW